MATKLGQALIQSMKEILEHMRSKAPRSNMHKPTKAFKDKKKYNRKNKHKGKE